MEKNREQESAGKIQGQSSPLSPGMILDIVNGFQESRILLTAIQLEVFSRLGCEKLTSNEIAHQIQADTRATDRLLNALTAMGLLQKAGLFFENTPVSRQYLDQNSPEFMWNIKHSVNRWDTWSTLTEAIQKGTCVIRKEEGNRDEEWNNAFIGAMHYRAVNDADNMVAAVGVSAIKSILDVGGGSGGYAMAFCRQNDSIRATIFDRPAIIPITKKYIEEAGFVGRIDTIAGDYHRDDFKGPYDLVIMSAIIHINTIDENIHLIRKGAQALNPGGRLVIQDFFIDETRTSPKHAVLFALNMLVATRGGDTYTGNEIKEWMTAAGLTGIERKSIAPRQDLLIGSHPGF